MNCDLSGADLVAGPFQGEVVKLGRWRRGLTQQELAAATGLAQSTVSRLESGKDRDPPFSAFAALSRALDLWHVAFLPWGSMRPYSPHMGKVHAVLSGCVANHFLHHRYNLLRCLHYCLHDAMRLRPDLCGLEVLLMGEGPVTRYGAMGSRHLDVVTQEETVPESDELATCVDHWRRRRPYWRDAEGSSVGEGFHEPEFVIDYPVDSGVVRWCMCARRQTESQEQTLHWVGAASRTVAQGLRMFLMDQTQRGDSQDLASRVARLERLAEARLGARITEGDEA